MTASESCLKLIQEFEGFSPSAYRDQNGVVTIGYGHTGGVLMGDTCNIAEADQFLICDLKKAENAVNELVKVPLTQNQFDALVSLAFNIGAGNFEHSTVLRELNANQYSAAADAFLMWNETNHKVNAGLQRRREAERRLFLTPPTVKGAN